MAIVLVLLGMLYACQAAVPLEKYNVDTSQISTSGISAGASMATQFHVAYSGYIMGVGMIAGSPYYCSQDTLGIALTACMTSPEDIVVSELTDQTERYESSNDIDPVSNLYDDRVFILHGTLDSVVDPGTAPTVVEYYQTYVNPANIETVISMAAEHTFPTLNYGNECEVSRGPYISDCDYDGAYAILNSMYGGGLEAPGGTIPLPGEFYEFDQVEFFDAAPWVSSMDDTGYVYVPSGCVSGDTACRLHIVFHGCLMGRHRIDDEFARNGGYNEVGELNNIIILYPQAIASASNPNGCFDWWGYTVNDYAAKGAAQPLATFRMLERLAL